MTAVEKYFFTPLYYPRGPWGVIHWWEARRPLFNLAVGLTGLFSISVVNLLGLIPPGAQSLGFPWGLVLVYGLAANLGYSLGPAADLWLRRILGDRATAVGPVLFRYGFVFSLGLTLLPVPVAVFDWFRRLFFPG